MRDVTEGLGSKVSSVTSTRISSGSLATGGLRPLSPWRDVGTEGGTLAKLEPLANTAVTGKREEGSSRGVTPIQP
jgi:hypothetical protein